MLGISSNSLIRIQPNYTVIYLTGRKGMPKGYINGELGQARYRDIKSFLQINVSYIIIADAGNHCLRSIDLFSKIVKDFVGFCTLYELEGSHDIDPETWYFIFFKPYHLEHDQSDPSKVYVTDQKYVRQIDVKTQKISKNVFNFTAVDHFNEERGIRQSDLNKEILCIII